jgi:hypothetical protein
MNDEAILRSQQITVLTEMFLGLGTEAVEERVAYYLRLLQRVPVDILRLACDHAVCESTNGFVPGPGQIIQAAETIHAARVKAKRKAWADEQWAKVIEARSVRTGTNEAE